MTLSTSPFPSAVDRQMMLDEKIRELKQDTAFQRFTAATGMLRRYEPIIRELMERHCCSLGYKALAKTNPGVDSCYEDGCDHLTPEDKPFIWDITEKIKDSEITGLMIERMRSCMPTVGLSFFVRQSFRDQEGIADFEIQVIVLPSDPKPNPTAYCFLVSWIWDNLFQSGINHRYINPINESIAFASELHLRTQLSVGSVADWELLRGESLPIAASDGRGYTGQRRARMATSWFHEGIKSSANEGSTLPLPSTLPPILAARLAEYLPSKPPQKRRPFSWLRM